MSLGPWTLLVGTGGRMERRNRSRMVMRVWWDKADTTWRWLVDVTMRHSISGSTGTQQRACEAADAAWEKR
jgi:hypothetical protein